MQLRLRVQNGSFFNYERLLEGYMGKLFRKLSALVFSVIPFSACQAEKDAAHFSAMSNQDNAPGEKMLLGTWVAYAI